MWIKRTEWMFWNFKPLVWSYSKKYLQIVNKESYLLFFRTIWRGEVGKISCSVWSILRQIMVKSKSSLPLSCSHLEKSTLFLSANRRFWRFNVRRQKQLPKAGDSVVLSLVQSCQEWREFAECFFFLLKGSQIHYIFKQTNAQITRRSVCHQENVDRTYSQ